MSTPKIGLALSGGSGRALAHAGVIDVLEENGIPIDYIAACSSATIVSAAYCCGTLEELKRDMFESMSRKELLNLIEFTENGSGLFSLRKAGERLRYYTGGANLEDVRPYLAFAAVDLNTGQEVLISMGDMVRGIMASCSIPGLFEPVKWGNMNLADGGLINVVPAESVRRMGADIVISVDIAASRYIFADKDLRVLKGLLWLVRGTGLPYYYGKKFLDYLKRKFAYGNFIQFYSQSDQLGDAEKNPNFLEVIGKVLSLSINRKKLNISFERWSDIIIEPKVKHYGKTEFSSLRTSYQEGRKAALNAVPAILKLIKQHKTGVLKPISLEQKLPFNNLNIQ